MGQHRLTLTTHFFEIKFCSDRVSCPTESINDRVVYLMLCYVRRWCVSGDERVCGINVDGVRGVRVDGVLLLVG